MAEIEPDQQLAQLQSRPRSGLKTKLVDAVLLQPITPQEKIGRIEVIDLLPEVAEAADAVPQEKDSWEPSPPRPRGPLIRPSRAPSRPQADPSPESEPEAVAEEIVNPVAREREIVGFARRSLGVPPRSGAWVGYLAKEYSSLLRFGFETSTLTKGWLPFTLKATTDLKVFVEDTLPVLVLPILLQLFPEVLGKAWSVLPKSDYNLLVALNDLVHQSATVRVPSAARSSKAWWKVLDPVLPSLALFQTGIALPRRTLQAWSQACLQIGIADALRTAGVESIRTLLEFRSDQISLPNAVLALAGLRTKRLVDLEEFVPKTPAQYFADESYDASPEVQAEIDSELASLVEQLQELEKQSVDQRRAKYFVPAQSVLVQFYQSSRLHPNHDHDADRSNIKLWAVRFLDVVAEAHHPLLVGKVKLRSGESLSLLHNAALGSFLERLEAIKEQLLDPDQSKNPDLMSDVARVLSTLGKALVVLIRNRSRHADPLLRTSDTASLSDPLPHETDVLEEPAIWSGSTFIEALVSSAQVCLLGARFLGDKSLDSTLDWADKLLEQAKVVLDRTEMLASKAYAAELRARWGQLLDAPDDASTD